MRCSSSSSITSVVWPTSCSCVSVPVSAGCWSTCVSSLSVMFSPSRRSRSRVVSISRLRSSRRVRMACLSSSVTDSSQSRTDGASGRVVPCPPHGRRRSGLRHYGLSAPRRGRGKPDPPRLALRELRSRAGRARGGDRRLPGVLRRAPVGGAAPGDLAAVGGRLHGGVRAAAGRRGPRLLHPHLGGHLRDLWLGTPSRRAARAGGEGR